VPSGGVLKCLTVWDEFRSRFAEAADQNRSRSTAM
jgi:hypothetical protein